MKKHRLQVGCNASGNVREKRHAARARCCCCSRLQAPELLLSIEGHLRRRIRRRRRAGDQAIAAGSCCSEPNPSCARVALDVPSPPPSIIVAHTQPWTGPEVTRNYTQKKIKIVRSLPGLREKKFMNRNVDDDEVSMYRSVFI